MDVEKAIRTRRTHKAFAAQPVPAAVLEELFELASWAPNHHLTSPWRFRVLGERTRERLMELAESEKPGAAAKLQRAPTLVAVSASQSGDPAQDREDLLATGVAAYLVLLGAHARGLAGYWRTVALLDDARGRAILELPAQETPVGLLYLGSPVQEQRVPERAPLDRRRQLPRVSALAEALHTLRPAPGDRDGPLVPMMVALTVVTGVVDAASYLRLGHVFVANMTGNVVFLGFAIAGAGGVSAAASLIALAAFLVGALVGGRLGARGSAHRGHVLRNAGAAQGALLSAALVLALVAGEPPSSAGRYLLVAAMALAMGVQNAGAQRLAVAELTTTVLTRTLTGLVSEAGVAGGAGGRLGRRAVAVAAMLLGALAGGLLVLHVTVAAALALAAAIVLAVALAVHALSHPGAPWG